MKKNLIIVTIALIFSLVLNVTLYFVIAQNDSNISSLDQQIEALKNNFESLNSTFQEYKNNHSHINTEYNDLMNSYEELTQTYENYVTNHTFSNSQYTTLQNQATDIQNQLNDLNQNYQDLLEEYDELLADYKLINAPARKFATIDDFQIELSVNKTIHSYTDSIHGSASIYYLNGTAFHGHFTISIDSLFGELGGVSIGEHFEVNGVGDFFVAPPDSFYYGPGNYSIHISQILDPDGYFITGWNDLNDISVLVEAK
ncbi:MAG: hypothetical protein ACOWW1_06655 [archaeon]|nr:hypothetical protein [Candidatus Bathyarchaeum sp.]